MSLPPCPYNWSYENDNYIIEYLHKNMTIEEVSEKLNESVNVVSLRIATIIYHLYKEGLNLSAIKKRINLPDDDINKMIYRNLSGVHKQNYYIRMVNYKLDMLLNIIAKDVNIDKFAGLFD